MKGYVLRLIECALLVTTPWASFSQVIPNDPYFSEQYSLLHIRAHEAWSIENDAVSAHDDNIVIAVLDDGFDLTHPDINYWINLDEIPNNGIDDDNNGYIDDVNGWNALDNNGIIPIGEHGTRVAGIAGAIGNNGIGIAGICWGATILPIRVAASTPSSVVAAYQYVLTLRRRYSMSNGESGAFIVVTNLSQSLLNSTPDDNPDWCAIYDELGSEGILNVNAPENRNREIGVSSPTPFNDVPALCPSEFLIVVTATTATDNLIEGPGATGSPWSRSYVDIAAPGQDIISTSPGGGTNSGTGTSFAAPIVAGSIALMFSAACGDWLTAYKSNPSQGALQLQNSLLVNTDPVGALLLLIRRGRLNLHRALLSFAEQLDEDLIVSGLATESNSFRAIRSIQCVMYSQEGPHRVDCFAGQNVQILPGTDIWPGADGYFSGRVSSLEFECSIPYAPLSVALSSSPQAQCSGFVLANASVTGGKEPYSFRWESRLTSSSGWTVHPATGNLLLLNGYYAGNFYLRVVVIDSRGIESLSNTNLVVCIDGMVIWDDVTAERDVTVEKNIDEFMLLYPNPVLDIATIVFTADGRDSLQSDAGNLQIFDNLGRLVYVPVLMRRFGEWSIDFSSVDPGWYLINYSGIQHTSSRRILKAP